MTATILTGDALTMLRTLPDGAVRCCVTSPPYWGLRDYGHPGQMGLESTPERYVENMVAVFREVRRVLADDGTLWLNLGDSYTGSGKGGNPDPESSKQATNIGSMTVGTLYGKTGETARQAAATNVTRRICAEQGMAPKNLVGIPWRVAFALQADGWYLRSDIIWAKPNPMPESVTDRPTKSHEYLFLFSKSARYYYDAVAIAEDAVSTDEKKFTDGGRDKQRGHSRRHAGFNGRYAAAIAANGVPTTRNARSVWVIPTQPYKGAHFATFPEELARRCILAGSAHGDTVLDPFGGSGMVGQVATGNGRSAILIELNPAYVALMGQRIGGLMVAR